MRPSSSFECAAETHVGCVRTHNEDNFVARPEVGLWAVADGMGGHQAGEVASATVVDALKLVHEASSAADLLKSCEESLTASNSAIRAIAAERDLEVIGTTAVVLLTFNTHFACLWSGDSRAYLVRDGTIAQITRDHTEVEELLAAGSLTLEQAKTWPRRNVITRAIGVFDVPEIDMNYGTLEPNDTFVLCSDGLTAHVETDEIQEIVKSNGSKEACSELIRRTLARGATDNVTVIVVKYKRSTTIAYPDPAFAAAQG
jgi:serine/threonine protein phosphatase PrpC